MTIIRSRFENVSSCIIADFFEAAVEVDEIPDQVFPDMIYDFFWNYNVGLIFVLVEGRFQSIREHLRPVG